MAASQLCFLIGIKNIYRVKTCYLKGRQFIYKYSEACLKTNHLCGQLLCSEQTGLQIIQVKLEKISIIGTLFKVRFIQDSVLSRCSVQKSFTVFMFDGYRVRVIMFNTTFNNISLVVIKSKSYKYVELYCIECVFKFISK